ncbi:MAG: GNAT family N-acetyltransferase [Anaerolineaceae bacterium]|nr:GNAT family N-acetyltransferase [Anaerolineaceae bacterium]
MIIHGKQLLLRDWRLDDLPVLEQWLQPGHRWQALDGPYYPSLADEQIPAYLENLRQQIEDGRWPTPRHRLVIADPDTQQLRGQVSWYWQSVETNWLSVGIVIYDPALWQQGLGYEALGLWCEHLLQTMPELVRLDLRTWSGNSGMMRLAQKLGFQEEARFRDARIVDGKYYDSVGCGILRREWQERYLEGFLAHLQTLAAQPAQRQLTVEQKTAVYQQEIARFEPELAVETVESNNEGLVNNVLVVNGRRVFRFPKHKWGVAHLRHEASCLALARQFVNVALPRWTVYESEELGHPFAAYDWIPGEALTRTILLRLPPADQQAIAEQLGTFLYQLHTVPLHEVEKWGIRPSVTNRTAENWQQMYNDVQEKLFPYLMKFARDWVEQHFAPILQDPNFMACEHTFMNGDLGCYHLLYNRESRRLNGIIDFGTAGLGDPANDFGCLIDQYGESFLRQMAPFYPGLEQHIERARVWAGTLELEWLLGGLRHPDATDWFMVHIGRARDVQPIGSGW